MLRKGIIQEKIDNAEYSVMDIFDEEVFAMRISGKQRMNYIRLEKGDEVYFVCSPYEPSRCRLITSTDFKMDDSNSLYAKKLELDKRQADKR